MDSDDEQLEVRAQGTSAGGQDAPRPRLSRSQALNLYVSHAFSTWNARGYEFATILFTAAAYPDTLAVAALRMVVVYFAMVLLSASVGQWVNNSPNRLWTLSTTIIVNRGSVILASLVWLVILSQRGLAEEQESFVLPKNDLLKGLLFTIAVILGIVERLSASGNLISMERDWVVTMAAPAGQPYCLTDLNAVMRRIDLVCKLFSPVLISVVISALKSTRVGVLYTGLTSLVCLPIELYSARRVWNSGKALQALKLVPADSLTQRAELQPPKKSWASAIMNFLKSLELYFSTSVWVPSLALAFLHYSMLTWRATFITYLINVGYSLNTITLARTIGSIFEISSTLLTPIGIRYTGRALHHKSATRHRGEEDEAAVAFIGGEEGGSEEADEQRLEAETIVGLQRFGLWGFSIQLIMLIPVLGVLWTLTPQLADDEEPRSKIPPPLVPSIVLFTFLAMSRLGVWIYDITTQQLTQTLVPKHQRASFAGAENSVTNFIELIGAGSAIVFPDTDQFKWLALASWAVVAGSWMAYAIWVRMQRGHLFHWDLMAQGYYVKERRW